MARVYAISVICVYMHVYLHVTAINCLATTDAKQVIRCHQNRFDQVLCPFNQVSNVTRVYVGKLQDTSQCTSRHDDCILDIEANHHQNIYNNTIRYCNGRSACTEGLMQSTVILNHCKIPNVHTDYMVFEYTCVQLTTGADKDLKSVAACQRNYFKKPLCLPGSYIKIYDVYLTFLAGGTANCAKGLPLQATDCVYAVWDSSRRSTVMNKCDNKLTCDGLTTSADSITCGRDTTRTATEMILQYTCETQEDVPRHVRVGNGQHLDKRLCELNQVISISSAYLVRRDGDDSTEGPLGLTDCAQSVHQYHLTYMQRQCDGYMGCQEFLINSSLRCKFGNMEPAEYVDIFYKCIVEYSAIQWMDTTIKSYINHILCPVETYIVIRGAYYVIPRGDPSPDGAITDTDCVTRSDVIPPGVKCNGSISCDSLYIGTYALYCNDELSEAKKLYLLYSCERYTNEQQYSLICPREGPLTMRCDADNLIYIRDILIGFGTNRTCPSGSYSTEDCVRHYAALDTQAGQDYETVVTKCNNTETCHLQAAMISQAQCNGKHYTSSDYTMVTFECRTEERQVWFCNDENILISCREGNVIHVDKFMFGDFYHLSSTRTCPSLLYDGYHGQYHCEVSVLTHNVSYHNEVIAACEGKTRCDSGLQALAGPALGWCRHDPDSTYALNYETPTDYVALYYYCHPGNMTTTTTTTTTTTAPTTTMTQPVYMNETTTTKQDKVIHIISIVVPVVAAILLVIIVVVIVMILRKRRRKQAANKSVASNKGYAVSSDVAMVTLEDDHRNSGNPGDHTSNHVDDLGGLVQNSATFDPQCMNDSYERVGDLPLYENSSSIKQKYRPKTMDAESASMRRTGAVLPQVDVYAVVDKSKKRGKQSGNGLSTEQNTVINNEAEDKDVPSDVISHDGATGKTSHKKKLGFLKGVMKVKKTDKVDKTPDRHINIDEEINENINNTNLAIYSEVANAPLEPIDDHEAMPTKDEFKDKTTPQGNKLEPIVHKKSTINKDTSENSKQDATFTVDASPTTRDVYAVVNKKPKYITPKPGDCSEVNKRAINEAVNADYDEVNTPSSEDAHDQGLYSEVRKTPGKMLHDTAPSVMPNEQDLRLSNPDDTVLVDNTMYGQY